MTSHAAARQGLSWGLQAVMWLALLALFIPFSPIMPGLTIDAAWALALNHAVAEGLAFGRDILFTLGPYAAIYTKAYHPGTAYLMYGGCLYLACSYGLMLTVLTRDSAWCWRLALAVMVLVMIYSRDALLLSYPLLAGLAVFKCRNMRYWRCLLALAAAPLGLLVLIKGTLLLLALAVLLTASGYLLVQQQQQATAILWAASLLALTGFWHLAHQTLRDLPAFLWHSMELAMSYSEAMAGAGNGWEVVIYGVSAIALLAVIARQPDLRGIDKAFLLILFALFLFCAFKAGFVRQVGHSLIAATAILMAACFLPLVIQSSHLLPLLLMAVVTWYSILSGFTRFSPLTYLQVTGHNVWSALAMDARDRHWRAQDFNLLQEYLARRVAFPPLSGTTDVYSFGQTFLIAAHAHWAPRPVFQSYSVFSAALARYNAHYLEEKAPDNIIFKLEPLDARLPSLEDGASWPALLTAYTPVAWAQDFLILKKWRKPPPPLLFTTTETHALGETVMLPKTTGRLFAALAINPTPLGRLLRLVYKPSVLVIELELQKGIKKRYRLIAAMAQSGFLLSPLVEHSKEFSCLVGNESALAHKRVKSLRVFANDGGWQWQTSYTISYRMV